MNGSVTRSHYDVLEVDVGATPAQIQAAFRHLMDAFEKDSPAIYSLFREPERRKVVDRIRRAYLTLSNTKARREYDRWLVSQGLLPGPPRSGTDRGSPPLKVVPSSPRTEEAPVEPPVSGELFADQGPLGGAALRTIRRERRRSLEELSGELRIPRRYLEAIEADDYDQLPPQVYVRGFVRAYARALDLDERTWVEGYLAGYGRRRGEDEAHGQ